MKRIYAGMSSPPGTHNMASETAHIDLASMRPYDHGDPTPGQRPDTIPACARCKHPAVYHGRALPRCDACDCSGYER